MRTCYAAEIPVNSVNLGLVYDYCMENRAASVQMTLTAPG